jgi:hypothetical protein
VEDDRRIDPVEELGPEHLLELRHYLFAHLVVVALTLGVRIGLHRKAEIHLARDLLRADVRGHDDDRVAEIDLTALGV